MDHQQDQGRQAALFERSCELFTQTTPEAVAEIATETAQEVLGLSINGIYLADAVGDRLQPVAVTDAVGTSGEPAVIEAGNSLAWQVFETGEPRSRESRTIQTRDTEVRSELAVPLGGHGVFLACSTEPAAFDDRTMSLATPLMKAVETALDQLDRQRQLTQQQDRLDAFIGNLSHDLRSPLSVAKAGVAVAHKTGTNDSLARVDRAHDRIQTLLDDLLTLAREGTTLEETDLEPVDLSAVATDAWTAVKTTGAAIDVDADETVIASRSRLQQLLENLFRNSVEHGSTGSRASAETDPAVTIRIGLLPEGFYVEDDGPGIAPADREAVFEAGHSGKDDGTGLGLRIVRSVADAHGWAVAVTEADDGGARFEITSVDSAATE